MNATWNTIGIVVVLALGAPVFAQDTVKKGGDNDTKNVVVDAKNAVVDGVKTAAGATKNGLSKAGEEMTDAWITTRVHSRFVGEDLLKGSDINVDTDKHVVTLKGTVTGRAARTKAGNIAKHTEGVHRVVNRLTVTPKRQA